MRILVVGAGAIGGYFGGRLLAAGRDVTFLVRPRRRAQLAKTGLEIKSQFGDVHLPAPPTVAAEELREPFDLILLSCKAYDLAAAAESFAPAVGAHTAILPFLNGMGHLDFLDARFGKNATLGGQCQISTTLDAEGRILHLNDYHLVSFGERDGGVTARTEAIASTLAGAGFDSRLSKEILLEMWEKWALIATVAGMTCLMRAMIGDVVAANGSDFALALSDECAAVAAANGFAPRAAFVARMRTMITTAGLVFAASMLRDIERGAPIEVDHIIGDLIRRSAAKPVLLPVVYTHLKAYEARRERENPAGRA
jgi:2-dehydropantoate 2-reductase